MASKSSSLRGDIPTNPNGVPSVVGLAKANRVVTETPTGHPERCIQQFVPSVALTLWFLSDPVVTDPCTVAIASVE